MPTSAQAAARALGNIGTPEAAKALEGALTNGIGRQPARRLRRSVPLRPRRWQARGKARSRRRSTTASAGWRRRRRRSVPRPCGARSSARGKAGIPLMLEAVRGADNALTAAAVRTAMELPGPEVTAALCDELPKLPADKQVLVITTLGYRGDASAGPALLAMASKGPDAVRLAAVQNLTHLGYAPALPLLAELSLAGEDRPGRRGAGPA